MAGSRKSKRTPHPTQKKLEADPATTATNTKKALKKPATNSRKSGRQGKKGNTQREKPADDEVAEEEEDAAEPEPAPAPAPTPDPEPDLSSLPNTIPGPQTKTTHSKTGNKKDETAPIVEANGIIKNCKGKIIYDPAHFTMNDIPCMKCISRMEMYGDHPCCQNPDVRSPKCTWCRISHGDCHKIEDDELLELAKKISVLQKAAKVSLDMHGKEDEESVKAVREVRRACKSFATRKKELASRASKDDKADKEKCRKRERRASSEEPEQSTEERLKRLENSLLQTQTDVAAINDNLNKFINMFNQQNKSSNNKNKKR